jgi:hypothetical protein
MRYSINAKIVQIVAVTARTQFNMVFKSSLDVISFPSCHTAAVLASCTLLDVFQQLAAYLTTMACTPSGSGFSFHNDIATNVTTQRQKF